MMFNNLNELIKEVVFAGFYYDIDNKYKFHNNTEKIFDLPAETYKERFDIFNIILDKLMECVKKGDIEKIKLYIESNLISKYSTKVDDTALYCICSTKLCNNKNTMSNNKEMLIDYVYNTIISEFKRLLHEEYMYFDIL